MGLALGHCWAVGTFGGALLGFARVFDYKKIKERLGQKVNFGKYLFFIKKNDVFFMPPSLYSRASIALFPCLHRSIPVPPSLYSRASTDLFPFLPRSIPLPP